MNDFELCIIPAKEVADETIESSQKWEQPFQELLDEIYWPGYAQDLCVKNSKEYSREFFYFRQLYC